MKESYLRGRRTKIINNLKKTDQRTSYKKQADKQKLEGFIDTLKRID